MNFYIVFSKNRKKIDKYMKVNAIRGKVIIDIKAQMDEIGVTDDTYTDYFNLLIFARIVQSLKKGKDIYYIPNFKIPFSMCDIIKIKENIDGNIKFNILMFFDEFCNDEKVLNEVLNNLNIFDVSQIIKDY